MTQENKVRDLYLSAIQNQQKLDTQIRNTDTAHRNHFLTIKTSFPFPCTDQLSIRFNISKLSFICRYMHSQIQLEAMCTHVVGPVLLFQLIQISHLPSFHMDFSCSSGPLIKYHLAPQKSQAWPWRCTSLIRPDIRSGHIQPSLNQMRSHDCPRLPVPPRAHHSAQLTLLNPNKSYIEGQ